MLPFSLLFTNLVLSVPCQGITRSSGPVVVRQEEASPGGGVGGGRFYDPKTEEGGSFDTKQGLSVRGGGGGGEAIVSKEGPHRESV